MENNNFIFTYFRNFVKVEGQISIYRLHQAIASQFLMNQVNQVRQFTVEGKKDEAAALKKKLPSITAAALFDKGRTAAHFKALTGCAVIDIDKLDASKVQPLKAKLTADKHVLMVFVSPSGNGLKIIACYEPPNGTLPTEWDEASALYAVAFNRIVTYFEQTYGIEVDTSGKDLTRLMFLSYDPDAYINPDAETFVIETPAVSRENAATGHSPSTVSKKQQPTAKDQKKGLKSLGLPSVESKHKEKETNEEYIARCFCKKGVVFKERRMALLQTIYLRLHSEGNCYTEGNRNNFIYASATQLNELGFSYDIAIEMLTNSCELLKSHTTDVPMLDNTEISTITKSVYTNQATTFGSKKIKKVQLKTAFLMGELKRRYMLMYNTLKMSIQTLPIEEWNNGSRQFEDLNDRIISKIWHAMRNMGLNIKENDIRKMLDTCHIPDFDPVKSYFDKLPAWDGTDYIRQLTDSVETDNPERFYEVMKKFLVGMIVTYFSPTHTNHIMPILYGGNQGSGKSDFLNRLLPPELEPTRHQGTITGKDDDLSFVAKSLLVSIDEVDQLDKYCLKFLKEIISREKIEFRAPYAHYSCRYAHKASFIGTCNDTQKFMNDPSGNRRYFPIETVKFHNDTPINYIQLYAQIKHLCDTGYQYYYTAEDQDRLAAENHAYEYNSDEYLYMLKYVRAFPSNCHKKESHTVAEIMTHIKFFEPSLEISRATKLAMAKALAREKYQATTSRKGKMYSCYLLNAEQLGYIDRMCEAKTGYAPEWDKFAPKEIIMAGRDAKIEDICKAREIIESAEGNIETAQKIYSDYSTKSRDISFTNNQKMPF